MLNTECIDLTCAGSVDLSLIGVNASNVHSTGITCGQTVGEQPVEVINDQPMDLSMRSRSEKKASSNVDALDLTFNVGKSQETATDGVKLDSAVASHETSASTMSAEEGPVSFFSYLGFCFYVCFESRSVKKNCVLVFVYLFLNFLKLSNEIPSITIEDIFAELESFEAGADNATGSSVVANFP